MIRTIIAASTLREPQQTGTGHAFRSPREDITRDGAAAGDGGVDAN
jgi:hypothetical protein